MYITQSLTRAMMLQGNHVIHRVFPMSNDWLLFALGSKSLGPSSPA